MGLSVEKKKRTKKEIHHWHESFFLLHDSIGRSYLFRFSFRFILFYLIVIFFFLFLPNIHGRQGTPISMYKRISYITFISSKDNVRICICITSSFIFFFIIYYYHLPLVSLFFFFLIFHIMLLLYILYYI